MHRKINSRGVITTLVSLLLVGVLSVGTAVIEGGRIQAARTQLAEATVSAATSMIASYNVDLYARYGLLAIDNEKFTGDRAIDYMNFNSDQSGSFAVNRIGRLYTVEGVDLQGMYNLTDPAILKRQLLTRAKYHVVYQDYALNVLTVDAFLADFQMKCQYLASQMDLIASQMPSSPDRANTRSADMKSAIELLYATLYLPIKKGQGADGDFVVNKKYNAVISNASLAQLPSRTGKVESPVLYDDLYDIETANYDVVSLMGTGFQNPASENYNETNVSMVNNWSAINSICNALFDDDGPSGADGYDGVKSTSGLLTAKIKGMAQSMNAAINTLKSDKEGALLLNSYITDYFSSRTNKVTGYQGPAKGDAFNGSVDNASFVSACVEYVFGGSADEKVNQETAYNYLFAIHYINNLYACFSDAGVNVKDVWSVDTHLAWAYFETLIDMRLQIECGASIPFNKDKAILDIKNPAKVKEAFASKNFVTAMKKLGILKDGVYEVQGYNAFSYTDSLAFALWFVPNTTKLYRVADLIQLEMRYKEQYVDNKSASFLMSEQNTYCRIKSVGKYSAILPIISLDPDNATRGISFGSIKYVGY